MPAAKLKLTQTHLRKFRDLDEVRSEIERLEQREADLVGQCVQLMREADRSVVVFAAKAGGIERVAHLEHPRTQTIEDVDRFEVEARHAGASDEQISASIKRSVTIAAARKLLDPDTLDRISSMRPGKPRIKITGNRGEHRE